ncbi:hypothetical protein HY641_02585 [Candidatus Woesearchaeota archaeon]|nr:hypothetical protein [Candidatus Woesearchaeota archaeon]
MKDRLVSLLPKLQRRSVKDVQESSERPVMYSLEFYLRGHILEEASRLFKYHFEMCAELSAQTRKGGSAWTYADMYARATSHAFAALKVYHRLRRCVAGACGFPFPMGDVQVYREQLKAMSHTIYTHSFNELVRARDVPGLEDRCEKYARRCERFGLAFEALLDKESVAANQWFANLVFRGFKTSNQGLHSLDCAYDSEAFERKARSFVLRVENRVRPKDGEKPEWGLYPAIVQCCREMNVPQPLDCFLALVAQEGPIPPRIP